jgi:hypothetical protein
LTDRTFSLEFEISVYSALYIYAQGWQGWDN